MTQWKIWGALMTQRGNWKPSIKRWGNWGLNYLMGKREIRPLMAQWNIWGPFDDAMGKLETLAMGKLPPPPWGHWWPRPRILSKRFNTAPLHSFKLMGPKY